MSTQQEQTAADPYAHLKDARCHDCGKDYTTMPLDVVLPDSQWRAICPEGGILCAACIIARAAKIPTVTVARLTLEGFFTPDPTPTYHTPEVVKERREQAAAINAAMNPTPAGKLSNKELGELGAKAAAEWLISGGNRGWSLAVHTASQCYPNESQGRTAFAAAVREQVEKEQAEEIARLTTELASLQRSYEVERHCSGERMAQILELQREVEKLSAPIKLPAQAMGDGTDAGVYTVFARGWNGFHHEFIRLNPGIRIMRECLSSDHRYKTDLAGVEQYAKDLESQLAAVTAERDRLQWRPVSVKPTREDADADGIIIVGWLNAGRFIIHNLRLDGYPWSGNTGASIWWRSVLSPPAPTAEEVERERFEKAYRAEWERCEGQDSKWKFDPRVFARDEQGRYIAQGVEPSWRMWQAARASKEVQA